MKKFIMYILITASTIMFLSCKTAVKSDSITGEIQKDQVIAGSESDKKQEIKAGNPESKETEDVAGMYMLTMSGYRGELLLENTDGKLSGMIKFYNWGNGTPQPLTDLRISDNKIYFKRVINTKEDLIRYGGTAFFEQDFYGIFSADKKKIKGYYRYAGTQDGWKADKKQ